MIENTLETDLSKKTVNHIEEIAGTHPGYRRAHAKGDIYNATFIPTGKAKPFTTAEHLSDTEVRAVVRFSNVSPNPATPDILSVVKGMSVQFHLPSGEAANLIGVTIPIFITKSPQTFLDILTTFNSLKDGKPHLKDMVKFFASYPESRAAFRMIRKLKNVKSYATGWYYAMHAFYLVNQEGVRTPVKFEWEPEAGVETLSLKEMMGLPKDYLEDELINRVDNEEVKFRLHIVLGEPDDLTDDPTKEWPRIRKRIDAGLLILQNKSLVKDDILYDPTILPTGIECSDDEILLFRKNAYAVSYGRRIKGE